ncbi:MAG TPA: hypothetical protein PL163_19110 [Leptospiraceae bacterium]|nr:hypothetical protein [Leptospiraceae bacterium]
MKRLVQKEVGNKLSDYILRGDFSLGERILVDYANSDTFLSRNPVQTEKPNLH